MNQMSTDDARFSLLRSFFLFGHFLSVDPCPDIAYNPRMHAEKRPGGLAVAIIAILGVIALSAASRSVSTPTRTAPGPIEVLGAPDSVDDAEGIETQVVRFIDASRSSLHGALYELSLPSVTLALRQACARGVDVKLFLESDTRFSPRERECLALLAGAIAIRYDDRRTLMHDKFLVADSQSVWTGSVNLTWTGCHLHYNEAVVVKDRRVAARYDEQFQRLFEGGADAPSAPPVDVDGVRTGVAFARGAARVTPFLEAVNGARQRIEIAAFSLTYSALVDALARRAREGVAVDVVLDARLARGPAGRRAAAVLQASGCQLRVGGPRPGVDLLLRFCLPPTQDIKIHHKLLVADGRRVVTGSANLSVNGFEHNDENVLWFDANTKIARTYEAILARARAASTEPTEWAREADTDNLEN